MGESLLVGFVWMVGDDGLGFCRFAFALIRGVGFRGGYFS